MDKTSYRGPLPEAPRAHDLPTLSERAFEKIIPVEMFLIRDVQRDDYGVDLQLEIKDRGSVTNFIAQVQLKSSDTLKKNIDGSVSLKVDLSNFNYMLNSPLNMGIYVLYLATTDELLYEWASNEYKRLEKENPGWQKNESTVTLRLKKPLDSTAVKEVHQAIINQYLFYNNLSDLLAQKEIRATLGKSDIPRLNIDTQSLEIEDASDAQTRLREHGIELVADGQARLVLELSHKVPFSSLQDAKAQLVLAYANYSQGHFIQSRANLANCKLEDSLLNQHEHYLMITLENACAYHLGEMTSQDFLLSEKTAIEKISDLKLKLQAKLYNLRLESTISLFKDNNADSKSLQAACRVLVNQAIALNSATLRVLAQIALLEIEGQICLRDFVQFVTSLQGRINLGLEPTSARDNLDSKLNSDLKNWKHRIDRLLQNTADEPVLFADAVLTGVKILFGFIFHSKYLAIGLSHPIYLETSIIDMILLQLRDGADVFLKHGFRHDELRARMLLADFHYYLDRKEEAKSIAEKLLPRAKAMRYLPILNHLSEIIEGNTDLDKSMTRFRELKERLDGDEDFFLPTLDDDQLKEYARFASTVQQTSDAASADIFEHFVVTRQAARERLHWCKHIDIRLTMSTHRQCFCPVTGHSSSVTSNDLDSVVTAFKGTYCVNCRLRQPKIITS